MTAKTRYLKTYRAVRAMAVLWYAIAAFCFFKGAMAMTSHNQEPSFIAACIWLGLCVGFIISAGKSNKVKE